MAESTQKHEDAAELSRLFAALAASVGESLGSLVGREIEVRPAGLEAHDAASFAQMLARASAVATGTIECQGEERPLLAVIELADAVAMAGMLMLAPEERIAERRLAPGFADDDRHAFEELCSVMYAGFGNVLRDAGLSVDACFTGHAVLQPGDGGSEVVGSGELVASWFRMKIGEHPESHGCLMVDRATAEAWNKAPLTLAVSTNGAASQAAAARDDEVLDGIPAAPVRGTLAAFVVQPEVLRTLRQSCRRVGLDLRRHGRGEIPNPAAHRNEIVLMDVPAGEDRRFEWCRRIKDLSASTRVVLLLHHPSRSRVTQAFVGGADAIVGLPCDEAQLSNKLSSVLSDMLSEPPIP